MVRPCGVIEAGAIKPGTIQPGTIQPGVAVESGVAIGASCSFRRAVARFIVRDRNSAAGR
jgi:hypothetical protein